VENVARNTECGKCSAEYWMCWPRKFLRYVCIFIFLIRIHIHVHLYVCPYPDMCIRMHIYMYVCIHTHTYVCIFIHTGKCTTNCQMCWPRWFLIYVYIFILWTHVYVSVLIHIRKMYHEMLNVLASKILNVCIHIHIVNTCIRLRVYTHQENVPRNAECAGLTNS